MKKKILTFSQIILAILLLSIIFIKMQNSGELGKLVDAFHTAMGNWPYLIITFIGLFLSAFFCTIRWGYLLEAQNVHLPFRLQFTLYLIGQFFSAFMLGSTGGDVVKAYYVSTETKHKRAEVVATVIVDRIVGIIALVILLTVITIFRIKFLLSTPETKVAIIFNIGLLLSVTIGLLIVFRRNLFEKWSFFRKLEKSTSFGKIIGKVYNAMHLCFNKPGLMPKVIFFSFLNHMSMVLWAFYIAMALGIPNGFIDILTVVIFINTIASIPLTPNGLGTRDSAAIFIMSAIGVSAATALTFSLLCYTATLVISLIGGIFYIVYAAQKGKAPATK
jgi:uncharacterized protein (TIRG00374 family)